MRKIDIDRLFPLGPSRLLVLYKSTIIEHEEKREHFRLLLLAWITVLK